MQNNLLLRLITFNIAHGRGLSFYQGFNSSQQIYKNVLKIAMRLEEWNADVVALQEVDEDSHWNKRINLLQVIMDNTNYKHSIMGVNNIRTGRKHLAYGNAILSKYPVMSWENQPFGSANLGEKGFLYAEVKTETQVIPIVNLHLDFRSRKRRIEQIEKVLTYLHDRAYKSSELFQPAPIICGDFNCHQKRAGDAVTHLFDYILHFGDYSLYPVNARTFPTYWPSWGIDFIFMPTAYKINHSEAVKSFLSDHKPVLIDFTLQESKKASPEHEMQQ